MKTKLISITKSLVEEKELTGEELIVYTARISNPENQLNTETSEKLINYLIKHKHWSPFEMVDMTIEITTSMPIAAQILRHRSYSFQQFSQRYSAATSFEPVSIRKSGATNRQSSLEEFDPFINNSWVVGDDYNMFASTAVNDLLEKSKQLYEELLSKGVAKECARMILPLAASTTLLMKGTVRSWIHYLPIRCAENTQLEHREIANSILEIFKEQFPNIYKNLKL